MKILLNYVELVAMQNYLNLSCWQTEQAHTWVWGRQVFVKKEES